MNENQKTNELLFAAALGHAATAWHRYEQSAARRAASSDREAWLGDPETRRLFFTVLSDIDAITAKYGRDTASTFLTAMGIEARHAEAVITGAVKFGRARDQALREVLDGDA